MAFLYDSKLRKIINDDYVYQKMTNGIQKGQYILYFKKMPYIVRSTVKELRIFVKAHYDRRKSCNFAEPKWELNFFDATKK